MVFSGFTLLYTKSQNQREEYAATVRPFKRELSKQRLLETNGTDCDKEKVSMHNAWCVDFDGQR